jgi:holo-[acyl-carrier protein] synthase
VIVGIGVDVVDVARLERSLERTPALAGRVFTDGERAYAAASVARLAARFAAKEAAAKALGAPPEATWREAEVVVDSSGRPSLRVSGRFAEIAAAAGVRTWHLTLSHDGGVAVAFVVAES